MKQPEYRKSGCSPDICKEESHPVSTLCAPFALVICPRGQHLLTGVHIATVLGLCIKIKIQDIVTQEAILLPLQEVE